METLPSLHKAKSKCHLIQACPPPPRFHWRLNMYSIYGNIPLAKLSASDFWNASSSFSLELFLASRIESCCIFDSKDCQASLAFCRSNSTSESAIASSSLCNCRGRHNYMPRMYARNTKSVSMQLVECHLKHML